MNTVQLDEVLSLPRSTVMSPSDMVGNFLVSLDEKPPDVSSFKKRIRDFVREAFPSRRNFQFLEAYRIKDGIALIATFDFMGNSFGVFFSLVRGEMYAEPRR